MRRSATATLASLLFLLVTTLSVHAQVDAVEKRPFYTLNVQLDPVSGRANGTVLVQYVNPTDVDQFNIAFALDAGKTRGKPVSRARVNRRNAEVVYKSRGNGDAYDGFELVSSRRMPPGVISQLEINFETRKGEDRDGLTWYTGDWFPRVLGVVDSTGTPPNGHSNPGLGDYDVTVEFPIDWRAALSGLPLREDGRAETVEIYNGAAGVTNYGIALARDLLVQETEVFGIRVRVFFHSEDAEWGTKLLADARNVVEFYKRRTAFKPPLVLNVIPGSKTRSGAEAAFSNTIVVHQDGPRPGTFASRIAVTGAITDLYWGFDNVTESFREESPLEDALSQYGVLRYTRSAGIGAEWTSDLRDTYYAGVLYDRMRGESEGVGGQLAPPGKPFKKRAEVAHQFTLLGMLEQRVGERSLERAYDEMFVFSGEREVSVDRLRNVVAVVAEDSLDEFFDTWYSGPGWMDARIREVVNQGQDGGKTVSTVRLIREGAEDFPVPVRMTLLDSTTVDATVPPFESEVQLRTVSGPAFVEVDPDNTLPLVSHAWTSGAAVAQVAMELGEQGDWGRALRMLQRAGMRGAEQSSAVLVGLAQARMHTGDYRQAKVDILEALQQNVDGESLLLLGKICDLLGDRGAAQDAYRRAQQFTAVASQAGQYLKSPYSMKP
ncbi:MAG: hypothetical protein V2A56_08545 [bacterium]